MLCSSLVYCYRGRITLYQLWQLEYEAMHLSRFKPDMHSVDDKAFNQQGRSNYNLPMHEIYDNWILFF
jgi:hypothetical protein